MRPGRASKTAEHNALFRALEAHCPERERVVSDPLAEAFLSWPFRTIAVSARSAAARRVVCAIIDRRWPGVRTSVVARTRLIDELVGDAIGDDAQLVILGAGYDTRAWRLDRPRGVEVFEVDHPDTQRRKRLVLARHHAATSAARFVPTDFLLDQLDGAMRRSGYDASRRTVFLWEGTTNYLDEPAVDATLRWCARAPSGSELIFTYVNDDVLKDPTRYEGAPRVFAALGRVNERMSFGIAPEKLSAYLDERGLELEQDTGAAQYRERFYGPRAADMRGHEFYRVAAACVR